MGKVIDKEKFKELKEQIEIYGDLKRAASSGGVSRTTILRVNKAKTYAGFKKILVKDRGPGYEKRKSGKNTWTAPKPEVTLPTPEKKKKSKVRSLLEFFDIKSARD